MNGLVEVGKPQESTVGAGEGVELVQASEQRRGERGDRGEVDHDDGGACGEVLGGGVFERVQRGPVQLAGLSHHGDHWSRVTFPIQHYRCSRSRSHARRFRRSLVSAMMG